MDEEETFDVSAIVETDWEIIADSFMANHPKYDFRGKLTGELKRREPDKGASDGV